MQRSAEAKSEAHEKALEGLLEIVGLEVMAESVRL